MWLHGACMLVWLWETTSKACIWMGLLQSHTKDNHLLDSTLLFAPLHYIAWSPPHNHLGIVTQFGSPSLEVHSKSNDHRLSGSLRLYTDQHPLGCKKSEDTLFFINQGYSHCLRRATLQVCCDNQQRDKKIPLLYLKGLILDVNLSLKTLLSLFLY